MNVGELKAKLSKIDDACCVFDANTDKEIKDVWVYTDTSGEVKVKLAVVDNRSVRTPLDDILDQV